MRRANASRVAASSETFSARPATGSVRKCKSMSALCRSTTSASPGYSPHSAWFVSRKCWLDRPRCPMDPAHAAMSVARHSTSSIGPWRLARICRSSACAAAAVSWPRNAQWYGTGLKASKTRSKNISAAGSSSRGIWRERNSPASRSTPNITSTNSSCSPWKLLYVIRRFGFAVHSILPGYHHGSGVSLENEEAGPGPASSLPGGSPRAGARPARRMRECPRCSTNVVQCRRGYRQN